MEAQQSVMNEGVRKVTFEEAKALLDAEPEAILLDVREEEEYITGHAAGARLFPLDDISPSSAAAQIPDKDTPVLLYCRSGRRSGEAAEKFLKMGYSRIYDVGSLVGWPYGMEW
jgi:rhodanese-related sulfurtransferase